MNNAHARFHMHTWMTAVHARALFTGVKLARGTRPTEL